MYKQEPPNCIQIELVEGCNLYCDFCGMQGIREKGKIHYKPMSMITMARLAKRIEESGWNSRIELAMHGEPTMHDELIEMVATLRRKVSNQIMMTSNGGGLLRYPGPAEIIENLFEAGLNILALDQYENVKIVPKILSKLPPTISRSYHTKNYPEDLQASPHKRWPKNTKALIVVKDISKSSKGTHSKFGNHCGLGAPLNNSANGKKNALSLLEK